MSLHDLLESKVFLNSRPMQQYKKLPSYSAIYLRISQDKIVYVGKTQCLKKRWRTHNRTGLGSDRIVWFSCRESNLDFLEKALIELLQPSWNIVYNSVLLKQRKKLLREGWV